MIRYCRELLVYPEKYCACGCGQKLTPHYKKEGYAQNECLSQFQGRQYMGRTHADVTRRSEFMGITPQEAVTPEREKRHKEKKEIMKKELESQYEAYWIKLEKKLTKEGY